jgi:predicted AAA+ superfamily ATPase
MCWPATCTPPPWWGRGPGRLRLPCFHFGPAVGVLPAFGDFTGMHVMPRGPGDRVVRGRGRQPARPKLGRMNAAFEHLLVRAESLLARLETILPRAATAPDWSASVAWRYRRRGSAGVLEPVKHVATIRLADLKEVDQQKERLLRNTAQFVAGHGANNVLLTGARGTGKSSLIKACLNEFAPQGLRLIEVDKADLVDLGDLVDLVAERPERFIVFCDDLSFDEGEPGYKALKSVLDGSVSQASDNLLIYATSNRRHLLPEYMKENLSYQHTEDGEVHPGEVIEEKISLSERFGLWISFYPFTQDEYLAIAAQWMRALWRGRRRHHRGAPECLVWALERGSRRAAWRSSLRATMRGGMAEATVMAAAAQSPRKAVDVAVGVLIDAQGRFLLTSRPPARSTPATGNSRVARSSRRDHRTSPAPRTARRTGHHHRPRPSPGRWN